MKKLNQEELINRIGCWYSAYIEKYDDWWETHGEKNNFLHKERQALEQIKLLIKEPNK